MKTRLSFALFASAIALASTFALVGRAHAGSHGAFTIFIDTNQRLAQGTLATVRKSSDTISFIGCKVTGTSTGSLTTSCSAKDASGVSVACTSSSSQIASAAAAVKGDSFLRFFWNSSNQCTQVEADNDSAYEPKVN